MNDLEQRIAALESILGRGNFLTSTVQQKDATFNGRMKLVNRTALPATCATGEMAMLNGVQYVCSAPDTWTASGGSGGSPGGIWKSVQVNDSSGGFFGDEDFTYWAKTVEIGADDGLGILNLYSDNTGELIGFRGLVIALPGGTSVQLGNGNSQIVVPFDLTLTGGGDTSLKGGNTPSGGDSHGGSVFVTGGAADGVHQGGNVRVNGGSSAAGTVGDVFLSPDGGFTYIPIVSGAPTGTPTGPGAICFDFSNNKLYIWNGTAWKGVVLT